MKLATLKYDHDPNLGNDIQTFAAEQLLPPVDLRLDYDEFCNAAALGEVSLVVNGYFGSHRTRCWPLAPNVRALFVGFHASDTITMRGAADRTAHPIGCRDSHTLWLGHSLGLQVYPSGCLTLCLNRFKQDRTDEILFVDVPEQALPQIPSQIIRQAETLTHHSLEKAFDRRREIVAGLLAAYSRASLVVTSRLHALLPCAAFGTPVVLIRPTDADAQRRFGGYEYLGWQPHTAPWAKPEPRVPAELVAATTQAARQAIRHFLEENHS